MKQRARMVTTARPGESVTALIRRSDRREVKETADTLIEDRGAVNALAWAEHCATRDTTGFWRKVCNAIDGVQATAMLIGAGR
jgi:hypothetical protein